MAHGPAVLALLAISVGLLGWLAAAFVRNPNGALPLLAGILVLPLFLRIGASGVDLGDLNKPNDFTLGQTLPLGIAAVMVCTALAIIGTWSGGIRWRRSPLLMLAAALIAVNVVSFLLGALDEFHLTNAAFLAQTVGPILCLVLGINFGRDADTVRRTVRTCVGVMGVSVLVMIVTAWRVQGSLRFGIGDALLGPFPIYASHDYLPLVVAVTYGLGLSLFLDEARPLSRVLLGILVAALFVAIFLLHSGGALFTAAFITLVEVATCRNRRLQRGVLAGVALIVVLVAALLPRASTLADVRDLIAGRRSESLITRTTGFSVAFDNVLDDPVAGSRYRADKVDLRGIRHLGNAHDQYLTYADRGGVLGFVLYVWIVVAALRRLRRIGAFSPALYGLATGLWSTLLGVALVSNFLQDNFVQPYSGSVLWLLLGLGEGLYLTARRSERVQPEGMAGRESEGVTMIARAAG
jgi:O-antigen ligase